jgi:hypothetical protein
LNILLELMPVKKDPVFDDFPQISFCTTPEVCLLKLNLVTDEVIWFRYAPVETLFIHVPLAKAARSWESLVRSKFKTKTNLNITAPCVGVNRIS